MMTIDNGTSKKKYIYYIYKKQNWTNIVKIKANKPEHKKYYHISFISTSILLRNE
jgi:hypothetical protein